MSDLISLAGDANLDKAKAVVMCHGMGLDNGLPDFERRFEWLETWRRGAETNDNQPQPAVAGALDYDTYNDFDGRWSQEIGQMKRQANQEGDTLLVTPAWPRLCCWTGCCWDGKIR